MTFHAHSSQAHRQGALEAARAAGSVDKALDIWRRRGEEDWEIEIGIGRGNPQYLGPLTICTYKMGTLKINLKYGAYRISNSMICNIP